MKHCIGIDLGTSTSEVAIYRNGRAEALRDPATRTPIVPSLIAVNPAGRLLVGEDARPYVDLEGQGVREIKREMGNTTTTLLGVRSYRPEDLAAEILKKMLSVAQANLGTPIHEAVVTCPANFNDLQRRATLMAAEQAGIQVLRLINEPTAAAMAFGIDHLEAEEMIVVFDFGGGTLDVSVCEMFAGVLDVKATYGDTELGGKNFDEAMVDLLVAKFSAAGGDPGSNPNLRRELKRHAELAKITLSNADEAAVYVPRLGSGARGLTDLDATVTRAEFERAVQPLLARAEEVTRKALADKKVRPDQVQRVLLVGGTTYMPCVRRVVRDLFGRDGQTDVDPDLAVSLGASIQAALLKEEITPEKGLLVTDITSHGLGIDIYTLVGEQLMLLYEPLIERNTPIPFSVKREYTLLRADQDTVEIRLFEDHSGGDRSLDTKVDTGLSQTITNIPPSQYENPHPIEIDFSYSLNGTVTLDIKIPRTSQSAKLEFHDSLKGSLPTVQPKAPDSLWEDSSMAGRYRSIIERAKKRVVELPPEKGTPVAGALAELTGAMADEDAERARAAHTRLVDVLFDAEVGGGG